MLNATEKRVRMIFEKIKKDVRLSDITDFLYYRLDEKTANHLKIEVAMEDIGARSLTRCRGFAFEYLGRTVNIEIVQD